jgi:hypothetical protein
VTASVALALTTMFAAPARADDTDLVHRIFVALDLPGEIARVAPGAAEGVGDLGGAPAADRRLLRRILLTGFDPRGLERLTLAAFMQRFDLAQARAAADWLAQPEIERLHAAGRTAAPVCEPDASDRTGVRARALARIAAVTSVEARARRHAPFVLGAMLEAASPDLPESSRQAGSDLEHLLRAQRDAAGPTPEDACRYRDFSTDELLAAQAFVAGETGRWLYGNASAAVEEALVRAARATARRIVDTFGGGPRRSPVRIALAAPARKEADSRRPTRGGPAASEADPE